MKKLALILMMLTLALVPADASEQLQTPTLSEHAQFPVRTDRLPGVDLADRISQVTGTAVSPLLGVAVVGAWSYFRTPEDQRGSLPWFSSPYAWGLGFLLLAVCFFKGVFGAFIPTVIKKPLDAAETLQNKVCAVLVCVGFVPYVVGDLARAAPDATASVEANIQMASMLAVNWVDPRFLLVPAAMIGFAVVWLACHAINVLILLSPFGFVDGILKSFKLLLVSAIFVAASIAPWLGLAVSLLIIYVAWLLAPWAFRLAVFGSVFSVDVFFPWYGRRGVRTGEPRAFLARGVSNVPVRTYGRLGRVNEGISFTYRPWLLFPERSVELPNGGAAIAKGLLYPSLECAGNDQKCRTIVMFRPCYRPHVDAIAASLGIAEVRDSPVIRGVRAVRKWLVDTVSFDRRDGVGVGSARDA